MRGSEGMWGMKKKEKKIKVQTKETVWIFNTDVMRQTDGQKTFIVLSFVF